MGSIVPSSLATGGSGETYERHVGAMFLSYLLTHNPPPAFLDCPVKEVSFQTGHSGWRTDDILVVCSVDGVQCKIAIQTKRNFTVGLNPDCVEVFQRFWEDFNAEDRFDSDKDAVALATQLSTTNLSSFVRLLDCARDSTDIGDLKNRLEAHKFVQKKVGEHYITIRHILEDAEPVYDVNDENIWRFLRSLRVLFLDFDQSSSQSMVSVMDMLSRSAAGAGVADATDAAKTTWNELADVAASSAFGARTLKYYDLPEGMRERHRPNSVSMRVLRHHTKGTLERIRTTIAETVTLPRDGMVAKTVAALAGSRVVALTGPAGSGKSVLARRVVEQESGNQLCLSFRAEEFAHVYLDQALPGSISARSLETIIESEGKVLIHLESLERLLESTTRDAFGDLVSMVEHNSHVSLLLTCRDDDMDKAAEAFFGQGQLGCRTIRMPPLNKGDIMQVTEAVPTLKVLLSRPESGQIMDTPYVLDMAARMTWTDPRDAPSSMRAFRKRWWNNMVRGDDKNPSGTAHLREQTLVDLAMRRARQMRPFVTVEDVDPKTLHALRSDGLIVMGDEVLVAPAHDVIEDWAVMRYVDLLATKNEWQAHVMAKDLGTSPAVRRGFRGWLRERLDTDSVEADRFVLAAYDDGSLSQHFREDMLISVLLSDSVRDFVSRQKDRLLEDDAQLLVRMVHLMRVACTKTPDASGDQPAHQSVLSEPEGEAWPVLLHAVDENHDRLLPRHFHLLLGLLEDWARGTKSSAIPDGAAPAVCIAYRLLNLLWKSHYNDLRKRVFEIIASVPKAESESFLYLVEQASSKSGWNNAFLNEFRHILTGPDGLPACRDHPEAMAEFVMSLRLMPEQDLDVQEYGAWFYSESKFGLRAAAKVDFRHFSAFCGQFWGLLRYHPQVGLRLVLDLVNHAGESYGSRCEDPVQRVTISVPGHDKVEQWANDRLWLAYRGTSDVPRLLMCALMALEYWLLALCAGRHTVESLLLKILGKSNNVMTTGVVASVCTAYPDLGGGATLALLESRYCIELDGLRKEKEGHGPAPRYAAANRQERYFDDERKISDALLHRRRDLGSLARRLRPKNREGHTPDGEGVGLTKASGADKDCAHPQGPCMPEEDLRAGAPTLYDWGLKRWRRDSGEGGAEPWQRALSLARDAKPYIESDWVHFTGNGPPVVVAVCVRDHWGEMSTSERRWCASALIAEVGRYSDHTHHHVFALARSVDSDSIAARSLPKILANDPDNKKILEAVARSLTHASPAVCLSSAKGVGEHLEPKHRNLVLRCAGAVAMLSNLSAGSGQRRSQKGQTPIPDGSEGEQSMPELARQALVDGSIDVEAELEDLDLASRRGRNAAVSIMHMLGRIPDLPATKQFIAKIGQAVVDTWVREYEVFGGPDQEFRSNATSGLAEIILSLPRTILDYCQPFLNMVDAHPDRVASFIGSLATHMDGSSAGRPFWDVWQAFADRIIKAQWTPDIVSVDSKGAELVRRMLFGTGWWEGPRRWEYLAGHEERVSRFVSRLPPTPHILASFAYYLYVSGAGSNPVQLKAVADRLQAGDPARLLDNEDTVYCLAYVLQRYVYGRPAMLKTDPTLRKDALLVLDRLVDAGSSAAYKMRDDFATPNVGK